MTRVAIALPKNHVPVVYVIYGPMCTGYWNDVWPSWTQIKYASFFPTRADAKQVLSARKLGFDACVRRLALQPVRRKKPA
jgi:hypothetical protein